jgi:SAM-dependent methyltransferase
MAQGGPAQTTGLPACRLEGSKVAIPDGGINYNSLTIAAYANREIQFLETLNRNANSINFSANSQKDAQTLIGLLRKISNPGIVGKMTNEELTNTGAQIWNLEKKVNGAYMGILETQIRKLASSESDPEVKAVMNQYAALAKQVGTALATAVDNTQITATDQKWHNLLRAHDYVESRDGNFLKSLNRFIGLVKGLPDNSGAGVALVGEVVNRSAQLDIDSTTARVEKALKLSPGATMSYVGVGNDRAYIDLALSKVGPKGKVVGEDIDFRVLENLKAEYRTKGNFSAVLGTQLDPRLAPGSSDSVLAKSVFHEFANPGAMLKGIWNALKPNGNLVIMEQIGFASESASEQSQKAMHHLSATKVRLELEKAGFEVVSVSPMSLFGQLQHQRVTDYMIVAKKCGSPK